MKCIALILAAGSSTRMHGLNKQFVRIGGIPVLIRSARAFALCPLVDEIIIAARDSDIPHIRAICEKYGVPKLKAIVKGGSSRTQSARNAFEAAGALPEDLIAVHDGARPFVSGELISRVIEAAKEYGAAAPAIPVNDTVKLISEGFSAGTPDRSSLRLIQTPQVFSAQIYEKMTALGEEATDDAALAEKAGFKVRLVEGDRANTKLTTMDDLFQDPSAAQYQTTEPPIQYYPPRIGHGYDVHRLVEGRRLIIGGVNIPYEKGLLGHSDADVLIHAVMDAILGALALGDIGKHFPDNDPAYKDADSLKLLGRVRDLMLGEGYTISSIDATVIAEKPKLAEYITAMRVHIARMLGTGLSRVSVKATTEEGLGLKGEGIAAHCVCILTESSARQQVF